MPVPLRCSTPDRFQSSHCSTPSEYHAGGHCPDDHAPHLEAANEPLALRFIAAILHLPVASTVNVTWAPAIAPIVSSGPMRCRLHEQQLQHQLYHPALPASRLSIVAFCDVHAPTIASVVASAPIRCRLQLPQLTVGFVNPGRAASPPRTAGSRNVNPSNSAAAFVPFTLILSRVFSHTLIVTEVDGFRGGTACWPWRCHARQIGGVLYDWEPPTVFHW